ncbi:30S ribosomal protein S3, partial [Candidatus Saccharibacteria bacterium]|nr:30S ribosomal protein S3 [Candidatus Saccharibacteria bacterium]
RGLEKRAHFRRIINEVADEAMGRGVGGIRIELSGRIAGREIARMERTERG